jgi:hypothetical protein
MRLSTRMVVLGGRKLLTPAALGSSLALWLDADDASTITLNGSTVLQWQDKSGNGRHAVQATAANQPIYNATGLNAKPVLGFDGTNSFMQAGDNTSWRFLHDGSKYIISGVWKPGAIDTPGSRTMVAMTTSNTSGSGSVGQYFAFGDSFGLRYNVTSGGSGASFVSVSRTYTGALGSFGNFSILDFQLDPANIIAGNRCFVSINGGAPIGGNALTGGVTSANSAVSLILGGFSNSTLNRFLGDIAELLIIRTEESVNIQLIQGYLAHKWGLAANLPGNHPFRFTPPLA